MRTSYVFDIATSNGVAYTAGDAIGATITLDNCVTEALQSGKVKSLHLVDIDSQGAEIDFIFFEELPTTTVDNNAFALSAVDARKTIAQVNVAAGDYKTFGARKVASKALDLNFQCEKSTAIYAQLVCRGTPTFASTSSLKLKVVVEKD